MDDEAFFRNALNAYLQTSNAIASIFSASDGAEALEILNTTMVDVVLTDVRMPHLNGVELAQKISERNLPCRVVALTTFDDEFAMLDILRAGAFGFILKSARPEEIIEAVCSAVKGGTTITPESATALRKYITHFSRDEAAAVELPFREQQVLNLLHAGKSNAVIASDLDIAETTVKKTIARLLQKYNVNSRLELVVATIEKRNV